MRLLLDTHIVLWVLSDDRRLRPTTRELLRAADERFVSAVSAWEIAIKTAAGKLRAPLDIEDAIVESGLRPIPMAFSDVAELSALPRHHADPFDRMLVAQARARGLTVLTHDRQLTSYDVPCMLI